MENTNTNTNKTATTAAVDALFAPMPTPVLTTDIPPRSQRNNETPFANLAQKAIENACKRDCDFQDGMYRQHNKAHEIIKMYYLGSLLFAEAVEKLVTECHRSRECAILNIRNSQYRRIYTAPDYRI